MLLMAFVSKKRSGLYRGNANRKWFWIQPRNPLKYSYNCTDRPFSQCCARQSDGFLCLCPGTLCCELRGPDKRGCVSPPTHPGNFAMTHHCASCQGLAFFNDCPAI